jgi:acyl-CoA thioester hydrolase
MRKFNEQYRVYYEDTDAGGIVYHANYLKFMERARSDWVRALGIKQQDLLEQSLAFVVIDMQIAFKQSAKLDDVLDVSCEVTKFSRASMVFSQYVKKENNVLIEASVRVACINTQENKPVAIPKALLIQLKETQLKNND